MRRREKKRRQRNRLFAAIKGDVFSAILYHEIRGQYSPAFGRFEGKPVTLNCVLFCNRRPGLSRRRGSGKVAEFRLTGFLPGFLLQVLEAA
jgi:hypothetical protein